MDNPLDPEFVVSPLNASEISRRTGRLTSTDNSDCLLTHPHKCSYHKMEMMLNCRDVSKISGRWHL